MSFTLMIIFNFSILVAGLIAVIRYGKIHKSYRPVIYCVWVACFNEIISFVLAKNGYYTVINNNIYVLIEALLIIHFFNNIRVFKKNKVLFIIIFSCLILIWFLDNQFLKRITSVSSYFRILSSFVIVLLSIISLNNLLLTTRKNLIQNSVFLLCVGFIIYFTYKILVEVFWLYGLNVGRDFQLVIYRILSYINLFTNLVYALAILWMPRKQVFTMRL